MNRVNNSIFIPSVHRSVNAERLTQIVNCLGVVTRVEFVEMPKRKHHWRRAFVHFISLDYGMMDETCTKLYYFTTVEGKDNLYTLYALFNRRSVQPTLPQLHKKCISIEESIEGLTKRIDALELATKLMLPSRPPPVVRSTNHPNDSGLRPTSFVSFATGNIPNEQIQVNSEMNPFAHLRYDSWPPPDYIRNLMDKSSDLEPTHFGLRSPELKEEIDYPVVVNENIYDDLNSEPSCCYNDVEQGTRNNRCSGCFPLYQPNQMAHMDPGGCLWVDDEEAILSDDESSLNPDDKESVTDSMPSLIADEESVTDSMPSLVADEDEDEESMADSTPSSIPIGRSSPKCVADTYPHLHPHSPNFDFMVHYKNEAASAYQTNNQAWNHLSECLPWLSVCMYVT